MGKIYIGARCREKKVRKPRSNREILWGRALVHMLGVSASPRFGRPWFAGYMSAVIWCNRACPPVAAGVWPPGVGSDGPSRAPLSGTHAGRVPADRDRASPFDRRRTRRAALPVTCTREITSHGDCLRYEGNDMGAHWPLVAQAMICEIIYLQVL